MSAIGFLMRPYQYAWANCGAEPGALLTAGDFVNIRRLFADRATPWLQHVTGYTDEAARGEALTFIDLVGRRLGYSK
jgi:hypothetical protein